MLLLKKYMKLKLQKIKLDLSYLKLFKTTLL